MRRAFCRLSGGDGGLLGERAGVVGLLCVFRRTRGAEEHCPGEAAFMGGRSARKTGESRAERNSGGEVGEKGDRAGKNRTWTDRAKGRKAAGDARRVRPRADRVCGGRNLRADGKCVWARRAESTCGVKPWIANSGRGRGVGRSGSACRPASIPSHISPLPAKPLGSIPEKRRAHRGCFSSFRHALCRKALPALLKTPGSHTPLCAPPGPDVLPDSGASAHGGGAGAALGKGKRISYDVMFFQVICFLFPSIRILLCRIR